MVTSRARPARKTYHTLRPTRVDAPSAAGRGRTRLLAASDSDTETARSSSRSLLLPGPCRLGRVRLLPVVWVRPCHPKFP